MISQILLGGLGGGLDGSYVILFTYILLSVLLGIFALFIGHSLAKI